MTTATLKAKHGDDPKYLEFRRDLAQRKWAKRKRARNALFITAGAKAVRLVNESGGQLLIHRATRTDRTSDWQLTTVSAHDGRPFGHNNPPTFQEAVLRAVGASEDCYWNEHGYEIVEVISSEVVDA